MDIQIIIVSFIVLILSIVIHEISHGSMANQLGDNTAKNQGRLSLNPLKHIDPVGTIMLPLFLFFISSPILIGWAKPVPVNFNNLTDKKWGELKVSLAGPGANLAIALVCGLLIRFLAPIFPESLILILSLAVIYNILLALFNLIPIPPLDGSHILLSFVKDYKIQDFLYRFGFFILIFVLFFTPILDFLYYLTLNLSNFITGGIIL
ncbi:MAG: site-2 protease family protein [Candidatus Pacebacteria bacterium]|nr:site-2 protease family protein [Candidatus Paceibacterota bacterium]MDD3919492.1 site-2 protease family protein [Candidatus Paceibacterota bacterium]